MAGTVIEKIKKENKHLQHKPSTGFHFSFLSPVAFDNDDMESSKRRVTFLSLIFLLKYNSPLYFLFSPFIFFITLRAVRISLLF